jgi:hypothetical protein
MFNHNVDSILKQFNKTFAKLEKLQTKNDKKAYEAEVARIQFAEEASRAERVKNKLAELIA